MPDIYDMYDVVFKKEGLAFRSWAMDRFGGPRQLDLVDEARAILVEGGSTVEEAEARIPDDAVFSVEKAVIPAGAPMDEPDVLLPRYLLAAPLFAAGLAVGAAEVFGNLDLGSRPGLVGWIFAWMAVVAVADIWLCVVAARREKGKACLFKALYRTMAPCVHRNCLGMGMCGETAAATALAVGRGEKTLDIVPGNILSALPKSQALTIADCVAWRRWKREALADGLPWFRKTALVMFGSVPMTVASCAAAIGTGYGLVTCWWPLLGLAAAIAAGWLVYRLAASPVAECDMACVRDGREKADSESSARG